MGLATAVALVVNRMRRIEKGAVASLYPHPDRDEVAAGNGDLREQCHAEAMKGYWSLLRVAVERDSFNAWRVARDVVSALDEEHSRRILK